MTDQTIIAVIDDDADFQGLMEIVLGEQGYKVVGFPVGEGAFQVIKDMQANLVILDIRLPGVSGYHVLNRLLTNPETTNIPVLVCTGEAWSVQDRERVLNEMGVVVLLKPFDLGELFAHIEQLTQRERAGGTADAQPRGDENTDQAATG